MKKLETILAVIGFVSCVALVVYIALTLPEHITVMPY